MTDFSANSRLPRGLGTWLGMGNHAYNLLVAIGSLVTTLVLTLGKLVADAMQGLIDIIVTGITVIVLSLSDRGLVWPASRGYDCRNRSGGAAELYVLHGRAARLDNASGPGRSENVSCRS